MLEGYAARVISAWQGRGRTNTNTIIVDNRVFLLGLDMIYREAMKKYEVATLLPCARKTAESLNLTPAEVPIEGYYGETGGLTNYFKWMRALQEPDISEEPRVKDLAEFQLIMRVLQSGLFGTPVREDRLLPAGRDPLSAALKKLAEDGVEWTIPALMSRAHALALGSDDSSLVGLAVRIQDVVVVAALRESVILYAERGSFGIEEEPEVYWQVDRELADLANRFIMTFNQFSPGAIPMASAENAEYYAHAFKENEILGRCVCLGDSGSGLPPYYHWGIYTTNMFDTNAFAVEDFWNKDLYTTAMYRKYNPRRGPVKGLLPT